MVWDFVLSLLILLVGLIYTSGTFQILDINLYDESNYLASGLAILRGLPSAENAPIYAIWYGLISLLKADSIDLYFLNYRAMTVLPAIALFIALRVFAVPRNFSIVISLGLLLSSANFPVGPKVSHFALILLLAGLSISVILRNASGKLAIIFFSCLLASYARPEYFLSAVIFGATSIILLIGQVKYNGIKNLPVAILLICLTGGVILYLGTPIGGGDRSMVAFGQHYSLNWVQINDDSRNPWTNWEAIVASDFGNASTLTDALTA